MHPAHLGSDWPGILAPCSRLSSSLIQGCSFCSLGWRDSNYLGRALLLGRANHTNTFQAHAWVMSNPNHHWSKLPCKWAKVKEQKSKLLHAGSRGVNILGQYSNLSQSTSCSWIFTFLSPAKYTHPQSQDSPKFHPNYITWIKIQDFLISISDLNMICLELKA